MRVTTLSTAAICSLGVIAAYGISNKVNGTPQPETPKDKSVAEPSPVPKLAVTPPVQQTIAPPETSAPQPLAISRNLAKERQQREARLAENLAKVSVPPVIKSGISIKPTASINIPDVKNLPIAQIVARSVGPKATVSPAPIPRALRADPPAQPIAAKPSSSPVQVAAVQAPPVQPTVIQPTGIQPTVPPVAMAAPTAPAQAATPQPLTSQPTLTVEPRSTDAGAQTQPTLRIETPATNIGAQPAAVPQSASVPRPASPEASSVSLVERLTAALPDLGIQNKTADAASTVPRAQLVSSESPSDPSPASSSPAAAPSQVASNPQPQATPNPSPASPSPSIQIQPVAQPAIPTDGQPIYPAMGAIGESGIDETYTLGPGDRLSLRFFNAPEYNGDVQVLSNGTLNLPTVGTVPVAGLTLQQAEAEIAARYQSELRYAVVTVGLQQPRPLQVSIVGEVQQPGSYTLSLIEGAQFPGIVSAIQTAGGTTQAADLRYVRVQRASRANPDQIIAVNLSDLVRNGNLSQDLKLRDGDRIVIPTATSVDFAEAAQLSASNVAGTAAQAFDVAVVGEVSRPGAYKMGGGEGGGRPSVSQAIQLAGGVKPSADLRQIQIRRATRTGVEQVINVDFFQLLQSGNLGQDLTLQQGDRVTIPTATAPTAADTTLLSAANVSPETISVNIVGEVKSPGTVTIRPGSTLNQAILAAGGLNNRATREIELIRLDANGTLSRRSIEVEFKEGFNTSDNPLILNNDIVVVGRSGATQFSDQLNQINGIIGPLLQLIPFDPFPF